MFCNEARLSALLNHPNLVQVYDFGEVDGSYYLAMEYLKGRTVLSVMRSLHARRRPFPVAAVAYIARQVALGLCYAHTLRGPEGGGAQPGPPRRQPVEHHAAQERRR